MLSLRFITWVLVIVIAVAKRPRGRPPKTEGKLSTALSFEFTILCGVGDVTLPPSLSLNNRFIYINPFRTPLSLPQPSTLPSLHHLVATTIISPLPQLSNVLMYHYICKNVSFAHTWRFPLPIAFPQKNELCYDYNGYMLFLFYQLLPGLRIRFHNLIAAYGGASDLNAHQLSVSTRPLDQRPLDHSVLMLLLLLSL